MAKVRLFFNDMSSIFLERVEFIRNETTSISIRGKTGGAYGNVGSFQWTSAVQALLTLLLRHRLYASGGKFVDERALIRGGRGSFAASLDYALTKKPLWLLDMFGYDSFGKAFASRLFQRTNPERKRGGEVIIGVQSLTLPPQNVEIWVNSQWALSDPLLTQLLTFLENQEKVTADCIDGNYLDAALIER